MNDLPLNGRNFTQILNLTPGVSTVNVSQNSQGSGGIWSNPIGTFSYPSVNGQTNRSNLFLLDGVNNQGSFGSTYAVAPIVDDIQEFKVQSHNDDASFGGAMGGIVNVVTKSGTSKFHGSAWKPATPQLTLGRRYCLRASHSSSSKTSRQPWADPSHFPGNTPRKRPSSS